MKLKTLLLGSATAMVMAGGAQAADLSIAEPVDYVRVCDAFGVGYWYIPGTDTCIKISGDVEFDATVYNDNEDYYRYAHLFDDKGYSHYGFGTGLDLVISTKSMTDWGPLEGAAELFAGYGQSATLSSAHISIGPLMVGWDRTLMTYMRGGYSPFSGGWFNAEGKVNFVRLTWAMNGFGLAVALEQPDLVSTYDYYGYSSFPDVVAALTFSNAMFDGKVSAVYSDFYNTYYDNGWAVAAGVTIKLDSLAPGDALLLKGAYGAAPWVISGAPIGIDKYDPTWSAMASFVHYMSPSLWASITANWASGEDSYDSSERASVVQAQFAVGYEAAPNFWLKPSVTWVKTFEDYAPQAWSDWVFNLRIQRDFGGK